MDEHETIGGAEKTPTGKNEKMVQRVAVRPEAIRIRKDDFFKNARSQFPQEDMASLKQSIADLGLLKQLSVERDPEDPDLFILLAGERRLLNILDHKKENNVVRDGETGEMRPAVDVYEFVEVKVHEPADDIERLKIMVAENGEHSPVPDWDTFQFALWLDAQTDDKGEKKYTRPDICRIFNKSSPWVSHTLQIADMPDRVKKCLQDGTLSRTAAVDLLSAKPEKFEFVLQYAESVVIRTAQKEKEEARRDRKEAEIEAECADLQKNHYVNVGDRIQARIHAKRGTEARRKAVGAQHREEKAQKVIENPVITEEAIKQTFDERPETLKPGVAPKTRSPKRMRSQLKSIKTVLDEQTGSEYITNSTTGRQYPRDDVHLVVAAYEQMLGQKPLDLFALLDDVYAARKSQTKEGDAA